MVSVVKNGFPVPAGEDHHTTLLEMADGSPPDVGLGDRRHRDRGLHAGGLAEPLEDVLQRQAVDDGREHAHVVGLGAVHTRARAGHPPPDVAAAHDDRDVDAELASHLDDLRGELLDHLAVDAVPLVAGKRLSRQLEEDALPARLGSQAPTTTWTKRTTLASPMAFSTGCFSSGIIFCSSST